VNGFFDSGQEGPPFTEEEYGLLARFFRDYAGLDFRTDSQTFLKNRLSRRLRELSLATYRDYYYYLLYNPARDEELVRVIDILTTNETYFFREERQLAAFREEILPEWRDRNRDKRTLRVWSAGCSTGEEPYTIAMIIRETGLFTGWQIDIFGSDISLRVLNSARAAVYRENSFRAVGEDVKRRYFSSADEGLGLNQEIRGMVNFGRINLLDEGRIGLMPKFEIIFCRNVLIYLSPEAKKRVVETFHRKLYPGGYLLLGHSESLMNITSLFSLKHLARDLVYQKGLADD
jgi:chemotaxis protein methyltransferase CheR